MPANKQNINLLTQSERTTFNEVANLATRYLRGIRTRTGGYIENALPYAPDVVIIKSPAGGMPGLNVATVSGTLCNVYQLIRQSSTIETLTLVDTGRTIEVFNLSTSDVLGNQYLLAERNKYGQWIAEECPCTGTPVITTTDLIAVLVVNTDGITDDDMALYLDVVGAPTLLGNLVETDLTCTVGTCRGWLVLPDMLSSLSVPVFSDLGGVCTSINLTPTAIYSTYLDTYTGYPVAESYTGDIILVSTVDNGCIVGEDPDTGFPGYTALGTWRVYRVTVTYTNGIPTSYTLGTAFGDAYTLEVGVGSYQQTFAV